MKVVKVYSLKQAFKDLSNCPICSQKPKIILSSYRCKPQFEVHCRNTHRAYNLYGAGSSLCDAVYQYNEAVRKKLNDK